MEARLEIEDARENTTTVYFKDDYQSAKGLVTHVEELYADLLRRLPEEEAGVCRSIQVWGGVVWAGGHVPYLVLR